MSKNSSIINSDIYKELFDFEKFVSSYYSRGGEIEFKELKKVWEYDYQLKGFLEIYAKCLTYMIDNKIPLMIDLGAGECKYSFVFEDRGIKYIGVDFLKGDERWDYRKVDIIADITEIPLQKSSIEVVMLSAVLEHIKEPLKLLKQVREILKEKGMFFGIVTFVSEEHQQPYDYFRYTRFGLESLLSNAGFSSVEVSYGNHDLATYAYFARRFLNLYIKNRFIRKAYNLYFEYIINRRMGEYDRKNIAFPLFYTFTAQK